MSYIYATLLPTGDIKVGKGVNKKRAEAAQMYFSQPVKVLKQWKVPRERAATMESRVHDALRKFRAIKTNGTGRELFKGHPYVIVGKIDRRIKFLLNEQHHYELRRRFNEIKWPIIPYESITWSETKRELEHEFYKWQRNLRELPKKTWSVIDEEEMKKVVWIKKTIRELFVEIDQTIENFFPVLLLGKPMDSYHDWQRPARNLMSLGDVYPNMRGDHGDKKTVHAWTMNHVDIDLRKVMSVAARKVGIRRCPYKFIFAHQFQRGRYMYI
jgi:hypothetical protein